MKSDFGTEVADISAQPLATLWPGQYAEERGVHFLRIESLAEVNGKMRVLDLKSGATWKAVLKTPDSLRRPRRELLIVQNDGGEDS